MVKSTVGFADFSKLDLRVGKVVAVEDVPDSDKLYRMSVDLGSDYGMRTIFVGVKPWYKKSQLKDKQFVFVANLTPRRMPSFAKASEGKPAWEESQGMMLAADGEKPVLIPVAKTATVGAFLR